MLNIHKIIVFLHQIPSLYCYISTVGTSWHPDRITVICSFVCVLFHWDALCSDRISKTMARNFWDACDDGKKWFHVPDHQDDCQDTALYIG